MNKLAEDCQINKKTRFALCDMTKILIYKKTS